MTDERGQGLLLDASGYRPDDPAPPVQTEAEWLLRTGPKFGHRVIKDQARRTVRIVLEGEVK